MATKKKLLQAAAGTAAAGGAGGLNVEDVFSTYLYEGNGSAQVIDNGINLGQSYGSGSVEFEQNSSYLKLPSEITLTGNFTIEAMVWSNSSFTAQNQILGSDTGGGSNLNTQVYIQNSTNYLSLYDNSTAHRSTSAVPQDQWVHIAITRSGSTVTFYINGTASGTSSTSATIAIWAVGALIAGPSVYEDYYGYLSNVRVVDGSVVYTGNFTAPTSNLTAITNTELLTCQGDSPFVDNSSNAYTLTPTNTPIAKSFGPFDAADAGEGGLVWIKSRNAAENHNIYDTERGSPKFLESNTSDAENSGGASGFNGFNSNGFSLATNDSDTNNSSNEYVSWTFRKAPKFFTCLTYSGTGSAQNISHNLGSVPAMIIVKRTDSTASWNVYHRGLNGGTNPHQYGMNLNTTGAEFASSGYWNNTAPTSTEFTVGTSSNANASGGTYVAYLFAHNDGDGEFGDGTQDIIKCGSYTGTGAAGNEVDLGFEPQWLLVKRTDGAQEWYLFDVMRGLIVDGPNYSPDAYLISNGADAENISFPFFSPTATGFVSKGGNANNSGGTFIYIAIRRGPMAVPTDATDVFDVQTYTGNVTANRKFTTGFAIDTNLILERDGGLGGMGSRLIDGMHMTSSTDAGYDSLTDWIDYDYNDGFELPTAYGQSNSNGDSYVTYSWQRRPNFFDVVAYTGTGSARTVSHNLGVAPEMIWVKRRSSAEDWLVYHSSTGNEAGTGLNETAATYTGVSAYWNSTTPTDTVFTVGTHGRVNTNTETYIAYLFASVDGVSKVGSYTGTGAAQNIDCGFSSGARFVLIKRTDSTSPWWLWDSERGIVSGAEPFFDLNSNAGETTGIDWLDPYSLGFSLPASGNNNVSSASYVFYAIA